ncbi:hypothetical protein F4778DRAFT_738917 [Xylariomycetidae sp. FL2044]|nr:hypothetical protein F4778DRAFT_738917 [Xylariomycetidae sp. FL2044]
MMLTLFDLLVALSGDVATISDQLSTDRRAVTVPDCVTCGVRSADGWSPQAASVPSGRPYKAVSVDGVAGSRPDLKRASQWSELPIINYIGADL